MEIYDWPLVAAFAVISYAIGLCASVAALAAFGVVHLPRNFAWLIEDTRPGSRLRAVRLAGVATGGLLMGSVLVVLMVSASR